MTITKHTKKDGSTVYRSSVYLGIDRLTGKKIKTTITARTKKEIKAKALQAQNAFIANGSTVQEKTTVKTYRELAELWLESYRLTVRPQTFLHISSYLDREILPYFGDYRPEKITPTVVQDFANSLPFRLSAFSHILSVNRRILQLGVVLRVLDHNPAKDIITPRRQKPGRQSVKFIDPKDLRRFLDHAEKKGLESPLGFYRYTFFRFLLATGCRYGEAVALDWSDIDLEEATVSIGKSYNDRIKVLGKTKTKAGERLISIDRQTVLLLKQYQNRQRLNFLELGQPLPSVVFATTLKERPCHQSLQQAIDRYCKAVGIERFSFHAFRHTHASLLLNAGIGYKELQYRLGHSQIAITLDTYSHLSKDKEKEAVSYFEKAVQNL